MAKIERSIVSYPQRGPWGDATWEGNTSGHLILDLIDTYCPQSVIDPMEGSGTTRDVCNGRKIPYLGYDLKQGYDLLAFHDQNRIMRDMRTDHPDGVDMVFLHPPYWGMVRYSNLPNDLCAGPYSMYLERMHRILAFSSKLLSPTGFIALLLADFRWKGRTYFMTDDMTALGSMLQMGLDKEARIIKIQHMTSSRGKVEHPGEFSFVHEYVTILRKRGAFV
jgi:hypothetical protein